MESVSKCISPKWKTPEEVMKFHRLKRKLSGRMSGKDRTLPVTFSCNSNNSEDSLMEFPIAKRRSPFPISQSSRRKYDESAEESGVEADVSSHSSEKTLFHLFDDTPKAKKHQNVTTFKDIMKHMECELGQESLKTPTIGSVKKKNIPIDWSLKSKIRFMSTKPFAWSGSMRTCEEVSAVTGFVRCLDPKNKGRLGTGNLDTSPNAQFHQSCLYWQHPHLPWLPVFSRNTSRLSTNLVAAQLEIAESLQIEWTIAFKSLLQLVRTQQCPFFYIVGTQFQCLFRAAGIAGMPEINAIISPTTRGFRKMLEREDVGYTMPLRKRPNSTDSLSDLSQSQNDEVEDDDDLDMEELMDSAQARKMRATLKESDRKKAAQVDGSSESLVIVKGMDVQGLFNLLVNCKNNMDRLPPTLLSPTAFQLATLKSCQVRDAVLQVDGAQLYSVQVEGPIMPQALSQMCLLLNEAKAEYSAAVATVKSTIGFTTVASSKSNDSSPDSTPSLFFLKENLSDCGLSKQVLSRLCESDSSLFGVIDSIEPDHVI